MGGATFYYFRHIRNSNDGAQPLRASRSENDHRPRVQSHDRQIRRDGEGWMSPMAESHGTACIACGAQLVDTGGAVHCRDCGWSERRGAD